METWVGDCLPMVDAFSLFRIVRVNCLLQFFLP
jgi:hypothetical protein